MWPEISIALLLRSGGLGLQAWGRGLGATTGDLDGTGSRVQVPAEPRPLPDRHLGEVSCRLGDGPQAEKGPASRGARVPRKCKCGDWCEPGQWQSPAALALLSKRLLAPPVEWNVAGAGGATEPFDLPVPRSTCPKGEAGRPGLLHLCTAGTARSLHPATASARAPGKAAQRGTLPLGLKELIRDRLARRQQEQAELEPGAGCVSESRRPDCGAVSLARLSVRTT